MAVTGPPQNMTGLLLMKPPLNLSSTFTSSSSLLDKLFTVNLVEMELDEKKELSSSFGTQLEIFTWKEEKSFKL